MGKKIKKASRFTIRTLLTILNKTITLIFALFCVLTGQVRRPNENSPENLNDYKFKGVVKSSLDSTIITGIQIVLYDVLLPVYGIGYPPIYKPKDSTFSTRNGEFEIDHKGAYGSGWAYSLEDVDGEANGYFRDFKSEMLHPPVDTSYVTLYMEPIGSGVKGIISTQPKSPIKKIIKGKNIAFQILNWEQGENAHANVVNLKGSVIKTVPVSDNGTLYWNTESIPRGIYLIQINLQNKTLNTKIVLK